MQVTLYIFRANVLFIRWLVLWLVSTWKLCSVSANLIILSQVETNAAHIIEVSLKIAYKFRPKHVGELDNK